MYKTNFLHQLSFQMRTARNLFRTAPNAYNAQNVHNLCGRHMLKPVLGLKSLESKACKGKITLPFAHVRKFGGIFPPPPRESLSSATACQLEGGDRNFQLMVINYLKKHGNVTKIAPSFQHLNGNFEIDRSYAAWGSTLHKQVTFKCLDVREVAKIGDKAHINEISVLGYSDGKIKIHIECDDEKEVLKCLKNANLAPSEPSSSSLSAYFFTSTNKNAKILWYYLSTAYVFPTDWVEKINRELLACIDK